MNPIKIKSQKKKDSTREKRGKRGNQPRISYQIPDHLLEVTQAEPHSRSLFILLDELGRWILHDELTF